MIALTPAATAMLVSVLGSPMATASAIMAKEMKADADLAGQLIVWTSILSLGTLFLIVSILRAIGWL